MHFYSKNGTTINDAKDLHLVKPMYNLVEYGSDTVQLI